MRSSLIVTLVLAASGLAALAKGVADGDVRVALLLFVPIVHGEGPWAFAGVLLIMAAFFSFALSAFARGAAGLAGSVEPEKPPQGRGAGVVLIGPVPIVFGDDPRLVVRLVLLTLAIVVLLLAFWLVRGVIGS